MAFYDYLTIPLIVDLKSTDKMQAIRQLVHVLCKELDIHKQKPIINEIMRREESASTFIGQGVALPQTRWDIKKDFAIVVGRSLAGVQYDAARGALANIIVLTIAKEDADANEQVQILSEMASFFKSGDVRDQIMSVSGPIDVRSIIDSYDKPVKEEPREKARSRAARKSTNPIVNAGMAMARQIKAPAILVFADAVRENEFLDQMKTRSKLLIITSNKSRFDTDDKRVAAVIQAPSFPASRMGQIKIGILLALSRNLIDKDDKVICLSGNSKNGVFDTLVSLDIAAEYEFFFTSNQNILPPDVKPEVLERVLGIAGEIAVEGREGRPTGTIFVVGDTNSVNAYVRQLIINPFRGYSEAERSVLDPGLDETIKEFAAIDGAFVITGDGIVLSAGSYLRPQTTEIEDLPSGFGARHAAAAGITACTNALAIAVSESTGMVTLFKNGIIMMTLSKPIIQDKDMIQKMI